MTNNLLPVVAPRSELARKSRRNRQISKALIYAVLVLYAIVIIFPFSIVLVTSFKTWQESRSLTFSWIPESGFVLDGYKDVFTYTGNMNATTPLLVRSFFNTLLYILPPTLLGLFTSSLAAYSFAKLRFRLKNVLYTILLATMMIPGTIMIVPQFSIYDMIGWVDTPFPLMIPGMFGAAACVFFMRQFFMGIPDSIVEAAKIDGVGYFGIFIRMIVPLSVPALLAQGLLGFIGGYNDYFAPMIYLQSSDLYNLQVALNIISSTFADQQNTVMAATLVALAPTLIIYFIAQDFFIEGISASGIKG